MKVICVDASVGFQSGEKPRFSEGQVLEATQSPYHELDYLIHPDKSRGWHHKRFIPLSEINEMELVEACNERLFA